MREISYSLIQELNPESNLVKIIFNYLMSMFLSILSTVDLINLIISFFEASDLR